MLFLTHSLHVCDIGLCITVQILSKSIYSALCQLNHCLEWYKSTYTLIAHIFHAVASRHMGPYLI